MVLRLRLAVGEQRFLDVYGGSCGGCALVCLVAALGRLSTLINACLVDAANLLLAERCCCPRDRDRCLGPATCDRYLLASLLASLDERRLVHQLCIAALLYHLSTLWLREFDIHQLLVELFL